MLIRGSACGYHWGGLKCRLYGRRMKREASTNEKKMLLAISVNKECCSQQAITLQLRLKSKTFWRNSEWESTGCHTQIAEMHIKGKISVSPDTCIFPLHTIALNSLTSDTGFSLINNNLLKSWLPGLCCKNSHIYWLLSHLFAAVSQSSLRSYLIPGLSLQFCKPNKT